MNHDETTGANKTDAGNGSDGICCVIDASCSPPRQVIVNRSAAEGALMGDASGPSAACTAMRVVSRTVLLLLVFMVPGSALDVATTELARRDGGFVELNPAGFLSLQQSILMEFGWVSLAVAAMAAGAYVRREALAAAPGATPEQFVANLLARNAWAVPLLWLPMFAALCRYPVVASNACYLAMGWSPTDAVLTGPLQRLFHDDVAGYVASIVVGIAALWYPATAIITRALYAAQGGGKGMPNHKFDP